MYFVPVPADDDSVYDEFKDDEYINEILCLKTTQDKLKSVFDEAERLGMVCFEDSVSINAETGKVHKNYNIFAKDLIIKAVDNYKSTATNNDIEKHKPTTLEYLDNLEKKANEVYEKWLLGEIKSENAILFFQKQRERLIVKSVDDEGKEIYIFEEARQEAKEFPNLCNNTEWLNTYNEAKKIDKLAKILDAYIKEAQDKTGVEQSQKTTPESLQGISDIKLILDDLKKHKMVLITDEINTTTGIDVFFCHIKYGRTTHEVYNFIENQRIAGYYIISDTKIFMKTYIRTKKGKSILKSLGMATNRQQRQQNGNK